MDSTRRNANLMLLLAAAIWGFAFVAQRVGMEHMGPLYFNGIRFALGAAVLLPFIATGRRASTGGVRPPVPWRYGALAGGLIFVASTLQQYGLVFTTAGKAGFITGLYVVFTPLLGLFWGQRTGLGTWFGVILATAGLYLLSAQGVFGIQLGDGLVLISALFWAGHVQWVGRVVDGTDPLELAAVQFGTCSALSLVGALVFETFDAVAVRAAAVPILYAGIMSVGGAYTLQVLAQRHARPAHTAIILSLEAVFAALGGWAVLGEILPLRGLIGCALMLGGVMLAQLGPAPSARQDPDRR